MKALSIRQPWAWLIINGFKNVENRDWRTNFRGWFLVHASAKMTRDDHEACLLFCRSIGVLDEKINGRRLIIPSYEELQRGGIVGAAKLGNCVTFTDSPWFTGQLGFVLDHAHPLPFLPCKGRLNFFEVAS